jgi:3-oxoacyl-[acyl-carrier protein] reductase
LGTPAAARLLADGLVVVIADLDAERAASAAAVIGAESLRLDVTDSRAVDATVADIVERHGRLDVLLTSHGFPRDSRLLEMGDEQWQAIIDVCLTGTFYCIRAAAKAMVARKHGRIITVSSRAWHGNPGQANYSAAKAGVVGLTKSVAKELGRHDITANVIAPGLIDSPSLRALSTFEQIHERAVRDNSIKRIGQPEDVAAAVSFLASEGAQFITGEVIHVSGGRFG